MCVSRRRESGESDIDWQVASVPDSGWISMITHKCQTSVSLPLLCHSNARTSAPVETQSIVHSYNS
jgi:hypothetical protein